MLLASACSARLTDLFSHNVMIKWVWKVKSPTIALISNIQQYVGDFVRELTPSLFLSTDFVRQGNSKS